MLAQLFVDFVNALPTPYHAVALVKAILDAAGFAELRESEEWTLEASGKYYVTRNNSLIVAFAVGGDYVPGGPIAMVGAHTDSPTLRLKPVLKRSASGFLQVGVECYGGGLWHTWFDRDLLVAGRVFVREGSRLVARLVKVPRPLLRIPTLAIHLTTERTKFEPNKETHLLPIVGQEHVHEEHAHEEHAHGCGPPPTPAQFSLIQLAVERHHEGLLEVVAGELGVTVEQIEDFELVLYDHQPLTLGGLHDEFIFLPRLDNLTLCYCAATALARASELLTGQHGVQMMALFDHEEIGSELPHGADLTFLPDVAARVSSARFGRTGDLPPSQVALAKSFLLLSDQAHGVHPNYADKHEKANCPELNKGPVIKVNANQRYATNGAGIVLLKRCADAGEVPLQLFVVKNDSPCGSTIGPILAGRLGVRTLDLGNPQLSMHSVRETGGALDIARLTVLFEHYWKRYAEWQADIVV